MNADEICIDIYFSPSFGNQQRKKKQTVNKYID